MPCNHMRRRGATVLFRRKIPKDLRDRFGSHEIVRSIGRAPPGEARRIVNRLWCQTELVFMQVRRERALTRAEIGKVVAAAVDRFRDDAELAVADIRPNVPLAFPCEPIDAAARMRGLAALLGTVLERNDVGAISDLTRTCAQTALDRDVLPASVDERRPGRAIIKALLPKARAAAE